MIVKNNFQIMKLNIEANMLRIQQLLNQKDIEKQFIEGSTWVANNRENAELRQRLQLLRKDSIKLEKILKE